MRQRPKVQSLALLRPAAIRPYRTISRSPLARWMTELLMAAAESKQTALQAGRGFYSNWIAFLLPGFLEAIFRQ